MPVLPKLAKRGVFGKNAILEMSLNPRKCQPQMGRIGRMGKGVQNMGHGSKMGFIVVPSVLDGVSDLPLREKALHWNRCPK